MVEPRSTGNRSRERRPYPIYSLALEKFYNLPPIYRNSLPPVPAEKEVGIPPARKSISDTDLGTGLTIVMPMEAQHEQMIWSALPYPIYRTRTRTIRTWKPIHIWGALYILWGPLSRIYIDLGAGGEKWASPMPLRK